VEKAQHAFSCYESQWDAQEQCGSTESTAVGKFRKQMKEKKISQHQDMSPK
jgi:hypothetical protein